MKERNWWLVVISMVDRIWGRVSRKSSAARVRKGCGRNAVEMLKRMVTAKLEVKQKYTTLMPSLIVKDCQ